MRALPPSSARAQNFYPGLKIAFFTHEDGNKTVLTFSDAERRMVRVLARYCVPLHAIANELNVAENTLRKYFALELAEARACQTTDVVLGVWRKAKRGDSRAAKLWFERFARTEK